MNKKYFERIGKKGKKKTIEKVEEEDEGGKSLDDAFADDGDVEYSEAKPRKIKKEVREGVISEDELEREIDNIETKLNGKKIESKEISIKASKPIGKIKKGDRIKIDGKEYLVDAHYVLIDHGNTKEMVIEIFDSKTDKDYQLRYFSDRVENSLELYELDEIIYNKKIANKIEW